MTSDERNKIDGPYQKMRQQLLARFVGGEVDRPAYENMLAEIELLEASGGHAHAGDTPKPVTADTASREPHTKRHFESIGNVPTAVDSAQRRAVGDRLGDFCLEVRIGRGGMGEVWKALDPVGDRHVVVKVLPPELQDNDVEMARVKTTFQHVHGLQHQHICPVYALGNDPAAGYYLVMKFIDGVTLTAHRRSYAQQHGGFPLAEVVRLLTPVAEALDYAHSKKIVHRDIKPQNILVSRDGIDVQLVDFGLAAEIRTSMTRVSRSQGDTSGTYPYMAPEQWKGEHQDGKSDQYALAVVAYELLSGRLPFEAPDAFILRQCALHEQAPQLSDQPDWVNAALGKGLAKGRSERFSTCVEFAHALAESSGPPVAKEPVAIAPVTKEPVAKEPVARQPVKQPVAKEPVAKELILYDNTRPVARPAHELFFEIDPNPPRATTPARPVQQPPKTAPRTVSPAPAPVAAARPQWNAAPARPPQPYPAVAPPKRPGRLRKWFIRLVILGCLAAYLRSNDSVRKDLETRFNSLVEQVKSWSENNRKADDRKTGYDTKKPEGESISSYPPYGETKTDSPNFSAPPYEPSKSDGAFPGSGEVAPALDRDTVPLGGVPEGDRVETTSELPPGDDGLSLPPPPSGAP